MSQDNLKNNLYDPQESTNWGFNTYSEELNGRLAMLGFFFIFFIEILTKEKIISLMQ